MDNSPICLNKVFQDMTVNLNVDEDTRIDIYMSALLFRVNLGSSDTPQYKAILAYMVGGV